MNTGDRRQTDKLNTLIVYVLAALGIICSIGWILLKWFHRDTGEGLSQIVSLIAGGLLGFMAKQAGGFGPSTAVSTGAVNTMQVEGGKPDTEEKPANPPQSSLTDSGNV